MVENIKLFLQSETFLLQLELFLRIIIAVFCGAFVGYERTNRGKEAGIRTHTIVAVASCLMMIISQYGFNDFFENFKTSSIDLKLDPSRVAAQIVTGIGFLGAGMIFIQKNVVTGLTTAAGIWAVAGIGMAIGSGMYFMGIICTGVIVVVQFIMHKSAKFTGSQAESRMSFVIKDDDKELGELLDEIRKSDVEIVEIGYDKRGDNMTEVNILAHHNQNIDKSKLLNIIYENKNITSAKL